MEDLSKRTRFNNLMPRVRGIIKAQHPSTQKLLSWICVVGEFVCLGHEIYSEDKRDIEVYAKVGMEERQAWDYLRAYRDIEAVEKKFGSKKKVNLTSIINYVGRRNALSGIVEKEAVQVAADEVDGVVEASLSMPRESFTAVRELAKGKIAEAKALATQEGNAKGIPEVSLLPVIKKVQDNLDEAEEARKIFERAKKTCISGHKVPSEVLKLALNLEDLLAKLTPAE